MGMDLYAVKPVKVEVQYGKRRTESHSEDISDWEPDPERPDVRDSCQIFRAWRDTDWKTWPPELESWYYCIHNPPTALRIAALLGKYYPEDPDLLGMAKWLRYWAGRGAQFELEY